MTTATVSSEKFASARLIVPRPDAGDSHTAVGAARELKGVRIRTGADLDKARGAKLAWMQEVTDLLTRLFDNGTVADYCNDWVGKIFPEYAEFGNFVEQFYDEMEYRLGKLRTVHKRVEQAAESPAPTLPATPHPSSAAPGPMEVFPMASMVAVAPVAVPSVTSAGKKVLLLSHGPNDVTADAVLQFMQQLGMPVVEADHANGLIETLESAGNDAGFVVVMNADADGDDAMFR